MKTKHNVIGIFSDLKGFSICLMGKDYAEKTYYFYEEVFNKSCSLSLIDTEVEKLKSGFKIAKIYANYNTSLVRSLKKHGAVEHIEVDISQAVYDLQGLLEDGKLHIHESLRDSFLGELETFDPSIINHRLNAVFLAVKGLYTPPLFFTSLRF